MKNFCLKFTINRDIIQLYVVIVYHSDIRETEERETHSKRPLLISTGRIIRKLKTISWCAHAWKISVSYGREASNNRRTMNREKSWRKNVGDFFSPDTCSFWLVLSRCIPSGEYKRKKWEKRKRKKKGMVTIRRRLISVRAKKLYVYPSKNNAIRNKRTRNATNWTCSENLSSRVFAIICDIEILMLRSLFQLHEDDFYLFYFNMEKLL